MLDSAGWRDLLGLTPEQVPRAVVCEGTWWRERALGRRLAALDGVRELGAPDFWHGWFKGTPVVYCPAYGASRVVEPVDILGCCGTPLAVQIGSCGGLQPEVRTGDVVVASAARIGEGASRYYGAHASSAPDPATAARAAALLSERGLRVHRGPVLTTSSLLRQPAALVGQWSAEGNLAVDMESSALFSAAASRAMRAVSLLYVWDELPARSWADPFTEEERAAHGRAESALWEVALELSGPG